MGKIFFKKKKVYELLADALEEQFRVESWRGLIPSGRDLADQHKVSLPTVQKAIGLLMQRKVLVSRGGNRRPGIATKGPTASLPEAKNHRVLVLTEKALKDIFPPLSCSLHILKEECATRSYDYNIVDVAECDEVQLRARVNEALAKHAPTDCITIKPGQFMNAVLARKGIKYAVVDGGPRATSAPRFGHEYAPLLARALLELMAFGHRSFFIPFVGRQLKPDEAFLQVCQEYRAKGATIQVNHCRDTQTQACMEKCMDAARSRGTTAIVFPRWSDFLYASTYFAKKGLQIPRDISVVVLVLGQETKHFSPVLAGHAMYSPESMERQFMDWIEKGVIDSTTVDRSMAQGWTRGGSIGLAPAAH